MIKDIYGKKIKYTFKDLSTHGEDGHFDSEKSEIAIHSGLKGQKRTSTILHEEIHAILHRVGLTAGLNSIVEEQICESIAVWLSENYTLRSK